MENKIIETRIKTINCDDYFIIKAETKQKLFAKLASLSGLEKIEDKKLEKEYYEWLEDWIENLTEIDLYS